MGHCLHAIVAAEPTIRRFANKWLHARAIALPQGFALTPLTDTLFDEITALEVEVRQPRYPGFAYLSSAIESALQHSSRGGAVVYFETEYFGGHGEQSAIAWRDEAVVFGSATSSAAPCFSSPINLALQVLGVLSGRASDNFDALNLGRYRQTELELG